MIITDTTKTVPTTWSNRECQRLFEHARMLGENGVDAGYKVTVDLQEHTSYQDDEGYHLRYYSEWDYKQIRAWIALHSKTVRTIWQQKVIRKS